MERRKVIKDFYDLISKDIESEIIHGIDLDELSKYKKILIMRTASNRMLHTLLNDLKMINRDIKPYLLGSLFDLDFLNEYYCSKDALNCATIVYDGRFESERLKEYRKKIELLGINAIVFLTYSPNREDYFNIEESANELSDNGKLPVYAYTNIGDIYKYNNIVNHVRSMKVLSSTVQWFQV